MTKMISRFLLPLAILITLAVPSYATRGGASSGRPAKELTQAQAKKKANERLRRERNTSVGKKGQFAGVKADGKTRRGNFAFRSKTDKNEKVFVNPKTGRTVRIDK